MNSVSDSLEAAAAPAPQPLIGPAHGGPESILPPPEQTYAHSNHLSGPYPPASEGYSYPPRFGHAGGPPPSEFPPNPFSYPSHYPARRKGHRASQACDLCRQQKRKCDEGRPECQHCKENNLKCLYREAVTGQEDKFKLTVTEKLESLQDDIRKILDLLPQGPVERDRPTASASLEEHLGSQGEIYISLEQRPPLRSLEDALLRLSSFSNWDTLSTRLVGYISALRSQQSTIVNPSSAAVPTSVAKDGMSRSGSRERASSFQDDSRTRNSVKRKYDDDGQDRQYFCFHESCDQAYRSGKLLENHIRSQHKDRWPDLPATCDHDGSIKKFRTWDESLSHLIFHQKTWGMNRRDYDKIHAAATLHISYSNVRVGQEGETPANVDIARRYANYSPRSDWSAGGQYDYNDSPAVFPSQGPRVTTDFNIFPDQRAETQMTYAVSDLLDFSSGMPKEGSG